MNPQQVGLSQLSGQPGMISQMQPNSLGGHPQPNSSQPTMYDQQQPPPQPTVQPQQPQQAEQKQDNISRVKHLYGQLYECLMETLRAAGVNINNNANIDQGIKRAGDVNNVRFEETLEKFYSVYDQMELHLKTAIDHSFQSATSQRLNPSTASSFNPTAGDNQKYAHYTSAAKSQLNFVKDLRSDMIAATTNVSNISVPRPPSDHHISTMDTGS